MEADHMWQLQEIKDLDVGLALETAKVTSVRYQGSLQFLDLIRGEASPLYGQMTKREKEIQEK